MQLTQLSTAGTEGSSRLAAPAVPALLTLTAEGVARVWVPVTMTPFPATPKTPRTPRSPQNPPKETSAAVEPHPAHFCVTLVVNPPAPDGNIHQACPKAGPLVWMLLSQVPVHLAS